MRPLPTPVALAFLLATSVLTGCQSDGGPFRIGYMICNSAEETRSRFEPLTAYLEETTGARFEPVYLDTFDVEEAYTRGELEFLHTNSLLYVTLRERHGVELIASEVRGAFGPRSRGVIIARRDSGLASIEDLEGRRLVFGPQWAPFGFLAQYALLLEAGMDPEEDLGYYAIPRGSWKHEKIIYSVLYGAFDAGAAPLIDLEEMTAEGKIAPEDFVVLARSALAPYCTVSASPAVSATWREKVRRALLDIDSRTTAEVRSERLLLLPRAQVDGFQVLSDGDYDVLRAWARRAKLPPYEEY